MSKVIVDVQNLSLYFEAKKYRNWNLRDFFISAINSPFDTLVPTKDKLILLDSLSFKIRHGDRLALIGVNGAGKTSLCRTIAGFYRPTLGRINVSGDIRAVFDTSVGILPELTGRENVDLLVKFLYPSYWESHSQIVANICEFSELGDHLDTPFRVYSNGMQARLCLSLISCFPADLLILDEVFDGADQFFKAKISIRVREMIEASGAVIFVSHSDSQVLDICNRAILIHRGKILFDGNPEIALNRYKNISNESC